MSNDLLEAKKGLIEAFPHVNFVTHDNGDLSVMIKNSAGDATWKIIGGPNADDEPEFVMIGGVYSLVQLIALVAFGMAIDPRTPGLYRDDRQDDPHNQH
jgi:hypothetical protein